MRSTRATPLVSKDRPRGLTPISPPFHLSVHLFTPQILGGRRIALSDVKRILQDAIGASRELESRSAKLREAAVTFEEEAQTELKALGPGEGEGTTATTVLAQLEADDRFSILVELLRACSMAANFAVGGA